MKLEVATFKQNQLKTLILRCDAERYNFIVWWMWEEDIDQLLTELVGGCINTYPVVQRLIFLIIQAEAWRVISAPALTWNIIVWRSPIMLWIFIIFMLSIHISGYYWKEQRDLLCERRTWGRDHLLFEVIRGTEDQWSASGLSTSASYGGQYDVEIKTKVTNRAPKVKVFRCSLRICSWPLRTAQVECSIEQTFVLFCAHPWWPVRCLQGANKQGPRQ